MPNTIKEDSSSAVTGSKEVTITEKSANPAVIAE